MDALALTSHRVAQFAVPVTTSISQDQFWTALAVLVGNGLLGAMLAVAALHTLRQ